MEREGPTRIGQIAIPVDDLERAVRFYGDDLGLRLLFRAPPGLAFFDCGGVRLMLSLPEGPDAPRRGGIVYYVVADLGAASLVFRRTANLRRDQMLRQHEPESPPAALAADTVGERLLRARTIIISGEISQKLAATVSGQLLALAAESESDITVFINSQGGHVEAGDTIHDLLRFIRPRVRMIGTGWVASAGALIFVAAPKEQRFCLPNTRFLLHQPAGGAGGTASDIDIEAREILRMRDRLNRIFARETGQPLERIEEDTHRNFWLGAEAALRYGLVGRIIERISDLDG